MRGLKTFGLCAVMIIAFGISASAQVDVIGSSGANATYGSLGSAFTAINGAGTQAGNVITVTISADTTESVSAVLNQNDWTSLTISPSGTRVITGAIAGHLLDLNGADNVTINGLNTLTISNTNTGGSASTIRFNADASNNTVSNCTVLGSTGSATTTGFGVIYFATGTTTGNDNNLITGNRIGPAGANLPIAGIFSMGSSTAIDNGGNSVTNNNIFDFFNSNGATNGMNVNSGSSGWTISGNSLYQTATRTYLSSNTHNGINITSGSSYTINNNFIGGSAASAGGSAFVLAGSVATRFVGINVSAGTATAVNSIQGNTVANITLSTTSGASTTSGILAAINVTSGNFDIGTTLGNIIGSTTAANNIVATSTTTGGLVVGINSSSAGTVNIQNNSMGGLTSSGSTAAIAGSVTGVNIAGTAALVTITGNTIGNAVVNNMRGGTTGLTTGSSLVSGVNLPSTPTTATITGNAIQNLSSFGSGTTGFVRGIQTTTSAIATAVNWSISNNTINNLTTNSSLVGIGSGLPSALGIHHLASQGCVISQNTISNISNTNIAATTNIIVAGIVSANAAVTTTFGTTINRNRIWGLSNLSIGTTLLTPPIVAGIVVRSGNNVTAITNNMVSLGNAQTSNTSFIGIWLNNGSAPTPTAQNVYFNSVNIEGTAASGALPSFAFMRSIFITTTSNTAPIDARNNIFGNARSGGTGQHFAISNGFNSTTVSGAGWAANAADYNVLNANAATIGHWTSALTIAGWRTASLGDNNSLSGIATTFLNAPIGDLHLNMGVTPTGLESGGTPIAGLTTDFDNQTRPGPAGSVNGGGFAPDLGADEFDGVFLDGLAPAIVYTPLINTSLTTDRSISVTITDTTGVANTIVSAPRIYYRKNAGSYFSQPCTLSSGTVQNGVWSCPIMNADVGGVITTDVIRYFVVAQDTLGNLGSNPGAGFVGTNVNAVTTPPTTPNQYAIVPTISGTFDVGLGQTVTSLTNTGGIFDIINNSEVAGNITINITSDLSAASGTLVAETGTVALNQFTSPFTITIKPSGGPRLINGPAASTALIRTNGASRVSIDGSLSGGTDRSLTIENTSVTSPIVVRFGSIGVTAITANTLKNCIILNGVNTSSAVSVSDSAGTAGTFNNITIQNNDIQRAFIGIFTNAIVSVGNGANLIITQNKLDTSGANAIRLVGVYVQGADGATVSSNTIGNFNATNDESDTGIWLATGAVNTTVSANTVSTIGYTGILAFNPFGIRDSSGAVASGNNITRNTVSGITSNAVVNTTGIAVFGIESSSGGTVIQRNNVQGIISTNTNTYGAVGINISAGNNVIVRNNFVSNVTSDMSGGGAFDTVFGSFGIRIAAGTGHQIYHNSVNLYGLRPGTANSSLLTAALAVVSSASTGMDIRNNAFANNITGGTTSVANVAVYLPSGGTSAMNLTMNKNAYFFGTDAARQGVGQAGTTAGTNFFGTLPLLAAYSGTLHAAATNDNTSQAYTTATPFVSNNDLHISNTASPLRGSGDAIPSVTTDFDGQTRSTGVSPNGPEIGADELTFTTISVPNVSFSPSNPAPKFVISNIGTSSATVAYTTQDGTAVGGAVCGAGVDYVSVSGGPIVINAGTSIDVNITLCADPDPAETFSLQVTNSSASFTGTNTISSTMTILGPTAASASVRGRLISAFGRNLANAGVAITNTSTGETKYTRSNQLGFFNFLDLQTGSVYVVSVQSKRFIFANHTFTLNEDLTDLVLTAQANDSKQ
jgi:Carboxypeptidase regulatory-like domain